MSSMNKITPRSQKKAQKREQKKHLTRNRILTGFQKPTGQPKAISISTRLANNPQHKTKITLRFLLLLIFFTISNGFTLSTAPNTKIESFYKAKKILMVGLIKPIILYVLSR